MLRMPQLAKCIAIVALSAVSASADTIDLRYTGIVGGGHATRARVDGRTYSAGHMSHQVMSGDSAGDYFNTFCIEVGERATYGTATYEIVDLADAPAPGSPYGQAKADAVSAVVANAHALGWIDANLQATNSSDPMYLAKMGAIQAAIWEALGHNLRVTSRRTSDSLESMYNVLMDSSTFDASMRMDGLVAIVAEGQQDMLWVVNAVPLPPAAFAGMGMLGLCAGVRTIRRRA